MRYIGNAFLVLFCAVVTARTVWELPPAWNWDVLGYMGLTLEWELDDPVDVHRETYAAAREELPPAVFRGLTNAGGPTTGVRAARHRNPEIFDEHIAFYRARYLSTLLSSIVHRAGVSLSNSVWWLSVASFLLTGLVIWLWLLRITPFWIATLGATLLLHAPPLLTSAAMATSDSLGTLLLALGAFLMIDRRATRSGATIMTLAILVRPDAIVLIGVLAAALFLVELRSEKRTSPGFLAVWLALSAGIYFGAGALAGGYGWWPLFHISFLQKELHPASLPTSPDWAVWLKVLKERATLMPDVGYWRTSRGVTGSTFPFVYAGFTLFALNLWRRAQNPERLARHAALLLALLATYVVRWLLFPQVWDRFFALVFVLVPLCALSMAVIALERRQNASNDETASITSP